MPDKKISADTTVTPAGADFVPIVQGGTNKKSTVASFPISTATQTALDGKVDENASITGATKTKITYDAKGLVTAGADATTADIAASTDKNYVTDAQAVVIGNTSGINSGNQTIANSSDATSHTVTLSASGGSLKLVEGSNITLTTTGTGADGIVTIASTGGGGGSGTGDVVGPASAVDGNFASYDTTTGKLIKDSGYNASSFAPALGVDDNYVTDAEKIVIGNTSGTNSGDQTISDATISTSDITTNNATTLKHGFLPKLSGNGAQYLDGSGNYSTPTAGVANSYSATTFTGQTSVNVVHNFGTYPNIQVMEGTSVIIPLSIVNNTVNDFTVSFVSSTSGSIIATVGSPQPQSVVVVTNNYTVLTTDRIVECSSAAKTLTLPTAVGNTGREFKIKNSSNGDIYVDGNGSETIDGELSQTLPSYSSMSIYSNGTSYFII